MKLLIVNGSPRGKKSNSKSIIERWMFKDNPCYDTIYALDIFKGKSSIDDMFGYDAYFFIFPLYVDSVPSILKYVFENMDENKEKFKDKNAYYLVHSGFPEACHSRGCEEYLEYFTSLIDMKYMGTGIMGGSEALQASPPDAFFKKKISPLKSIALSIQQGKRLNASDLKKLAGREKLPFYRKIFMKVFNTKFYWNMQLKHNNAYENRKDKPLLD